MEININQLSENDILEMAEAIGKWYKIRIDADKTDALYEQNTIEICNSILDYAGLVNAHTCINYTDIANELKALRRKCNG